MTAEKKRMEYLISSNSNLFNGKFIKDYNKLITKEENVLNYEYNRECYMNDVNKFNGVSLETFRDTNETSLEEFLSYKIESKSSLSDMAIRKLLYHKEMDELKKVVSGRYEYSYLFKLAF